MKTFHETVLRNPYIPYRPTVKQAKFLLTTPREVLYGGAGGGGKSSGLLMAALQYVHVPGYAALLLRKTYADLALPGALMERAAEWLRGSDAHWSATDKRWTFPSSATLSFGYLQADRDRYRYQSSELQFIGFDELTQFEELPYRFLFSRLRRRAGVDVPLRMRAATNPGGIGGQWVKQRFITQPEDRLFIPARLEDNPGLDREEYIRSLSHLPPVLREQILNGNWDVIEGGLFQRFWFPLISEIPRDTVASVRFWDLAATEVKPGKDPDWTAGCRMARDRQNRYPVLDMRRLQGSPANVESLVRQTAEVDGRAVPIEIEQEPGSAGKALIDHYIRNVLPGWNVKGIPSSGDKVTRAAPLAAMAEAGNVMLLNSPWVAPLLDEIELFPEGGHDDQVDALSGAFRHLSAGVPAPVVTSSGPSGSFANPKGAFGASKGSFHKPPGGVFG